MAQSGIDTLLRRVVRHSRTPRSLPTLLWKNIRYAIDSRRPEYWSELAREQAERGQDEEALECYDRALRLKPDVPQWLIGRGNALRNLGRFATAEASLRRALQLRPESAVAHLGLGNILYSLGRVTEAQESYRTALRLQPKLPRARFLLGRALLRAGQFEEGWKEFEGRWRVEQSTPPFCSPSWNGEAIGDRVLLLFACFGEGQGDAIQFCRYVPQIAAGAGRIILVVPPSLVRIMSRLPGVGECIAPRGSLPAFDLHSSLMRLPHVLWDKLDSIPAAAPYLAADPADVAHWRNRLTDVKGLRVGLCWAGEPSGSPGYLAWNRRRSMRFDTLAPLSAIPGVQFISLQKGLPAVEASCPPHGMKLHDFTADLHDFADTAALIENLDLVISIDTAVAHLAGALGKPTWLLNPFDACWRWLLDRDDSPWYPSLRQFRQPTPWDWQSVVRGVADALQRLAAGDQSQLRPPTQVHSECAPRIGIWSV